MSAERGLTFPGKPKTLKQEDSKMKKFVALLLVLLMCLALFACGQKTEPAPQDDSSKPADTTPKEEDTTPADTTPAEPEGGEEEPAGEEEPEAKFAGYFDDDVDHYARKKYTLCYAMPMETSMHDEYLEGFYRIQDKYNFELVFSNSNNDAEQYVQNIEIMAAKGVDGFFIDCPNAVCVRVKELLEELGVPYIAFNSPLYDENNLMACPGVVQDGAMCGKVTAEWFCEHYKDYWGDIDTKDVTMLTLTSSSYPEFAKRSNGARAVFEEHFPGSDVQEIDMTGKGVAADGAYDMVTPVITTQPDVKYWYIQCGVDNWGQGAARAVEGAGLEKNSLVCSTGNVLLVGAWEEGYEGCWCCGAYTTNLDLAVPAVSGLIALIDGRTTPEELWKERAIPGDSYGDNYGIRYSVVNAMTKDNYKSLLSDAEKRYGIE